jgi:RimJ/RimL family protein N-acetyltransferase
MAITVRRAREGDSELLFNWRNDPVTRAASLSTAVVDPVEHDRWFRASLADPGRFLYVVVTTGTIPDPIGMCRFDAGRLSAEVSINLNPAFRGKGLSGAVLAEAIATFRAEVRSHVTLTAVIRSTNEPSIRLFEGAGFREVESIGGVKRFEQSEPQG